MEQTPCPPPEQLGRLACNDLPPAARPAVERHLRDCPACREALAQLTPYRPTETWAPSGDTGAGPAPEEPPPDQLRQHPRYRLLGILGRGGMGTVYKAEHRLLDRPVVLKVIRPELLADSRVVRRFQQEARLAARLAHPNVVGVYEAEEFGHSQMLVMEFVEGVNLAELVAERGLLPVAEACELVRQAAAGLEYVREQGLVHRDIKPGNLLVSRAGRVKILDLGMATLKGDEAVPVPDMTGERQFVGTVDYASPEQWESSRNLDIRADIYSLGCTFYYLLAGEAPFPHKKYTTMMQQMWAHGQAPLPPIRGLRPDVPEAVAAVLTRMLAKNRDDRFAAPAEVAAALAPFTQDCNLTEYVRSARRTTTSRLDLSRVSAAGQPPAPAPKPPPRRRRLLLAAAGLGVALAAAVGAVGSGRWWPPPPDDGGGGARAAAPAPPGGPPPPPPGGPPPPPPVGPPPGPPIRIGILHSSTGTMAISERPVIDATRLAVDEINAAGGVLGRPVEAVVEDGESDAPTFAGRAEKLIAKDRVCAVFGCWTSASRKTALPVFERHDHLLFYPVQYEGLEQSPHVVYTGAAPNQQIIPAVRWCVGTLRKRRLFLVGSDYVFPRTANEIIRDEAADLRAEVVGEAYVRFGSPDVGEAVRALVAAQPDAVLNTINGDGNVAFFRALRAAGVTPDRVPTISFSLSEEELSTLGARQVVGDYAASNYFQSVDRPQNHAFVRRFRARYPQQRTISDPMEAAYVGVHLWAQAVRDAGTEAPARVREAVRRQSYDGPGGPVRIDPDTLHTSKVFRIGLITAAESRFRVTYESPGPIGPIPYPNTRSKAQWDAFLRNLHRGWGGRWENPGPG
jgi:urea transport system substrate-binding protein